MNGDIGIGKIIKQERGRDAIHIAVAPVTAGVDMNPGRRAGIASDGKAMPCTNHKPGCQGCIGIVDPFLLDAVEPGQKFYLFLDPGSITSLRHEWIHPAFKDADPVKAEFDKAASEKWLREYAAKVNPYYADGGYYNEKTGKDTSYDVLMEDLRSGTITYHGIDMHDRSELIDEADLAFHASIVLGRQINFDHFKYFSCSC